MKRVIFPIIIGLAFITGSAAAKDSVYFADADLKACVESALGITDPTPTDMLALTSLTCTHSSISNLTGLEYATNLTDLWLGYNQISDISIISTLTNLRKLGLNYNQISNISPLAGLTNLRHLKLHYNQISNISPLAGLTNLTALDLSNNEISDLSPLAGLTNLTYLCLHINQISDLSPLAGLTNLTTLYLHHNQISNISPLAGLTNLIHLYLDNNQISDISALSELENFYLLELRSNQLNTDAHKIYIPMIIDNNPGIDIYYDSRIRRPVVNTLYATVGKTAARLWGIIEDDGGEACQYRLKCKREGRNYTYYSWYGSKTTGEKFDFNLGGFTTGGLISDTKYYFNIQARNSAGESDWGDEQSFTPDKGTPTIVSMTGGSVVTPGEGTFQYEKGILITVEAKANPNYQFANWTGTAVRAYKVTNENSASTTVLVDGNYTLIANFAATFSPIYVDDDAPGDPGPNNADISDPDEDGTWEHPFDKIQEGIDVAVDGYTVYVISGRYYENINLKGKNITVMSLDPSTMLRDVTGTIIDGNYVGTVVTFDDGEDPNCVLNGFTITCGRAELAGGIYCFGSSPTICNCLIVGNRAYSDTGSGVYCRQSNATISNCTISGNDSVLYGGGSLCCLDSSVTINSCIIWGNSPDEIYYNLGIPFITYSDTSFSTYSDTHSNWQNDSNINIEPYFAAPGYWDLNETPEDPNDDLWVDGDYHLKSQSGRRDPNSQKWIVDDITSPCIDAGDPNSPVGDEPSPNGNRINIGAYGGTTEASMSLSKDSDSTD